jgi:hypothetical protein
MIVLVFLLAWLFVAAIAEAVDERGFWWGLFLLILFGMAFGVLELLLDAWRHRNDPVPKRKHPIGFR